MLPQDEWLDQARRLHVGMTVRIRHGRETRDNLVIGNLHDRWYAYCHKCHEGGVVEKDHVVLTANTGPVDTECKLPDDIKPVLASEFELPVAKFLASKNMDQLYLPELFYSEKRKRLLIRDDLGRWHGRDLTGRSPMKWMNYSGAHGIGVPFTYTAVTEDAFSMYKVRWAMRQFPNFNAVCNLGTSASLNLVYKLSRSEHTQKVGWFFDADAAGDTGAEACHSRCKPFSFKQYRVRPPEGLDPKDMTCTAIRELLVQEMQL